MDTQYNCLPSSPIKTINTISNLIEHYHISNGHTIIKGSISIFTINKLYIDQNILDLDMPIELFYQDNDLYYLDRTIGGDFGIKVFDNGINQILMTTLTLKYTQFLLFSIINAIYYTDICNRKNELNILCNELNKYNQLQPNYNQLQNDNKTLQSKINSTEVAYSRLEYTLLHTKDNLIDCMEEIDH